MILTLNENKTEIISNELIYPSEREKEIQYLEFLYSSPNFELGYLEHGSVWFLRQKPENMVVTKDYIQVFDQHKWGVEGIHGMYPIEFYTTKAKNTLFLIRQMLGKEVGTNFSLRSFFDQTTNEILDSGILSHPDQFSQLLEKLYYLLQAGELANPMLRDYYLDFYLFTKLLDMVSIQSQVLQNQDVFSSFYREAEENTEIMRIAHEFQRIRKK